MTRSPCRLPASPRGESRDVCDDGHCMAPPSLTHVQPDGAPCCGYAKGFLHDLCAAQRGFWRLNFIIAMPASLDFEHYWSFVGSLFSESCDMVLRHETVATGKSNEGAHPGHLLLYSLSTKRHRGGRVWITRALPQRTA